MEQKYVHNIYDLIADDFDKTRFCHWSFIKQFILDIEPKTTFLDLGCGNGKYFALRNDLDFYALDNCKKLIDIVNIKYPLVKTTVANIIDLPYDNDFADTIISIAVIHHLETEEKRILMIKEIIRTLKINGKCLITAWAITPKIVSKSTKLNDNNDFLIPWKSKTQIFQRFYHLFQENELEKLLLNFSNVKIINSTFDKDNFNVVFTKLS
jgi:tRNA (uracil-5-)-methyltransferase TRM9